MSGRNKTSGAVEVGEATAALEQTPAGTQAPLGTDATSPAPGVPAGPRHRRCTRRRHHRWGARRQTLTGWALVTCLNCGETDLT